MNIFNYSFFSFQFKSNLLLVKLYPLSVQPFKSHFYVLVLGMFSFGIFVVLNAFVLSWVCLRFVLKSPHIPCTVFTMTFFSWNVFSLTFKGVKTGHLSWCLPHHVLSLCLGRAELLESATCPRPSFHILRAQKGHWSFCTMSFIFPNFLVNNLFQKMVYQI